MLYKNNIGPQVRRKRYALGWSQSIFAAKLQGAGLDISRGTLSKIEARLRFVDDKDLMFLAEVLQVPVQELFPPPESGKRLHEVMEKLETTRFQMNQAECSQPPRTRCCLLLAALTDQFPRYDERESDESRWSGSNRRQAVYKTASLPLSYTGLLFS